MDSEGALYGESALGIGSSNTSGTIYKLTPLSALGAPWTETVLYVFPPGFVDGFASTQALLVDTSGVVFGVTPYGGGCSRDDGCGAVFSLTPPKNGSGAWTKTNLYNFRGGSDGFIPNSPLLPDGHGGFYGTTGGGGGGDCIGGEGCGTVYNLTPPSGSQTQWTETVLYSFQGGNDGNSPLGPIALDASGALYGATGEGGSSARGGLGWGTIFKLTPPPIAGSPWTETILHAFQYGQDGGEPYGGVVMDRAGAIYGATYYGGRTYVSYYGNTAYGTIFKIVQ